MVCRRSDDGGGRWFSRGAVAAVALTGTAALAAVLLWRRRRLAAQRTAKRAAHRGQVPSLAEEIREALEREAVENFVDMPTELLQAEFAAASEWVASEGGGALGVEAKLELYGAYKQVTSGDAPEQKPRGMEAKMKWDAWRRHTGLMRAESMAKYVAALDRLAPGWRECSAADFAAATGGGKHRPDGGSSLGFSVSTMGRIGDPDKADDVDETPVGVLCEMIANGETEQVCQVLSSVPTLAFEKDKDGMTPLHWAADRGDLKVAKALICMLETHPASAILACLNSQDETGDTPLHYAVNTDNVELARLLCSAGANPTAVNDDGETPESLAGGQELWELVAGALDASTFEALRARA